MPEENTRYDIIGQDIYVGSMIPDVGGDQL
jgi:hypothetical protein